MYVTLNNLQFIDIMESFEWYSLSLLFKIILLLVNLTPEVRQLKSVVQIMLGQHLKAIRVSKKMKQKFVADRCGFSRSGYNLMEKGDRNITFFSLLKISKVLNEPLENLVKIEGIDEIPNLWI